MSVDNLEHLGVFYQKRALFKDLLVRSFWSKYSNTTFGFLWMLFTPLLVSLVISFVFTKVTRVEMRDFTLYVVSGMLPWMYFSGSIRDALNSLRENSTLWKQFGVPLIFIPASSIAINFITLLLGMLISSLIFCKSAPEIFLFIWMLPIAVILYMFFAFGISLLLLPWHLKTKDLAYLLDVFFLLWLWCTPVFYTLDIFPPLIRRLSMFNPLVYFLSLFRSIFYERRLFHLQDLSAAFIIAVATFIIGYSHFIFKQNLVRKRI